MSDARAEIQAAIDATPSGGVMMLPDGLSVVGRAGGAYYSCTSQSSIGIRFDACGTVAAVGNRVTGAREADAQGSGIYVRAVDPDVPFDLATIVGNVVAGFGSTGIDIRGNGMARLSMLRAVGNTIGDAGTVQSVGMSLDDGTHALQASDIVGNAYGAGVTSGAL